MFIEANSDVEVDLTNNSGQDLTPYVVLKGVHFEASEKEELEEFKRNALLAAVRRGNIYP